MAAADMFLMLEGIPGEEKEPKNAIRIESWSWGENGGGSQGGKVNMSDFSFAMEVNKASAKILEYCASGTTIKNATLTCKEASGAQEIYLVIKLIGCKVSYFHTSVEGGGTAWDQFSLKFEKIEYDYKAKGEDGKRGGSIKTNFDLTQTKVY